MGAQAKSILEQLAFVTRDLREPVVIADAQGFIVAVNDAARAMYGDFTQPSHRKEDWPRQFEVLHQDGHQLRPEDFPLNRAVCGEQVDNFPLRVRRKDAREFIVLCTATPIKDGDTVIGAMSVHRVQPA